MLPQVTTPMGSSMGHVRNLDLSDLFLDIYHFYTKALLSKILHYEIFPQKCESKFPLLPRAMLCNFQLISRKLKWSALAMHCNVTVQCTKEKLKTWFSNRKFFVKAPYFHEIYGNNARAREHSVRNTVWKT